MPPPRSCSPPSRPPMPLPASCQGAVNEALRSTRHPVRPGNFVTRPGRLCRAIRRTRQRLDLRVARRRCRPGTRRLRSSGTAISPPCGDRPMDTATYVATLPPGRAAAGHGCARRQHRECRHARLQGRARRCSATGWRASRARSRRAAGGPSPTRRTAPPIANCSRARCRTPAIRSTSRSPATGFFTVDTAAGSAADPGRPLRADAGRHHRRRRTATRCSTPTASRSRSPRPIRRITIAGRRHDQQRERRRSARSAWCEPTDPMRLQAEGGRLVPRRHADRAGRRAQASCRARWKSPTCSRSPR